MKLFKKTEKEKELSALYKEWDKQRSASAPFGPSHVSEIDAVFIRHEQSIMDRYSDKV